MLFTKRSQLKYAKVKDTLNSRESGEHEFLMSLHDQESGLRAYVAIHNTNRGPALGGTRMVAYESDGAAIEDVLNLSRAMSYKNALANLPYGGGKGVILLDQQSDRRATLKAYSRLIDKLGGLIRTGTDVGISDSDVVLMGEESKYMLGLTDADRGDLTTGKTAALGVYCAMKASLRRLNGNNDFNGIKVAIKGAGKLGEELTRLITNSGGQVFISDINPERCNEVQQKYHNVNVVHNDEVHKQHVDIYSPNALGNEFTVSNINQLNCRAIVGGANNQLADEETGNLIFQRGILYAPDYIVNAGGLIYVADELEPGGFNKHRVVERVEAIEGTLMDIFERAAQENIPNNQMADIVARSRIAKVHSHGE